MPWVIHLVAVLGNCVRRGGFVRRFPGERAGPAGSVLAVALSEEQAARDVACWEEAGLEFQGGQHSAERGGVYAHAQGYAAISVAADQRSA